MKPSAPACLDMAPMPGVAETIITGIELVSLFSFKYRQMSNPSNPEFCLSKR